MILGVKNNYIDLNYIHFNGSLFFFFSHINVLATVIYKRYILPSMNVITIGTLRGQGS
jgi:hypothetical protein